MMFVLTHTFYNVRLVKIIEGDWLLHLQSSLDVLKYLGIKLTLLERSYPMW